MDTKVVMKLLQKAGSKYCEAEKVLDDALKAWLQQMNFPDYISEEFWITFASGGENIVHYGHNDMIDMPLERLLGYTREQVIDYFDIDC